MYWTRHRAVQDRLQQLLGRRSGLLEHPFHEIDRIADLYWPSHDLVFEIQVSPIHPFEVAMRTEAYNQIGIGVVWILHDCLYNRRYLTGAELYLQGKLHYYTNINHVGVGEFYDVSKKIDNGKVIAASPRFPVRLNRYRKKPVPHFHSDKQYKGWSNIHFKDNEGMRSLATSNPYRRFLDHVISQLCAADDRAPL